MAPIFGWLGKSGEVSGDSSSLTPAIGELHRAIFLDRVERKVVGGEEGANLGAFGVARSLWN